MRYCLGFLMVLLPVLAFGQDLVTPYDFAVQSVQVVYSDSARVRDRPALAGAVVDTVFAMQQVTIVAKKDEMASGSKRAAWYQVRYSRNGQAREGYLWGGLLALGKAKLGELQFVYGVEGKFRPIKDENGTVPDDTLSITIGLKAYKGAAPVDAVYYDISAEAMNGTYIAPMAAKGVPESRSLLCVSFSGEACGIPTYRHYFGWTGERLIALPPLIDEGDAGAYAHSEKYVFPGDAGGHPGMLVKKIEDVTYEELPNGKEREHTAKSTETYRWDAGTKQYMKTKKPSGNAAKH